MEGILRKKDNHYFFWSSDWNPDKKEGFVANTTNLLPTKLSLKNCQAIERGYDLDELAEEYCTHEPKNAKELRDVNIVKLGFRDGFQKALEILGDKKFSGRDINTAYSVGYEDGKCNENFYRKLLQSLQQTEWDCIILEEPIDLAFYENGNRFPINANLPDRFKYKPKLDADGNLILKRK